ncbi:arabinogalactan oligomer / maltooligosaccharide transport system permease protein [Nocardioides alpinus]|uniref:Maltose/maltodextrin transport system permease protein n=1 Tax=Nocardioides alpinus TaxID=748909 RepID=A0A1I1B8B4_9ACTN|nr:ABC transporter permease subunit [Nocardioides alpinus]PKH39622.1 sugar ABC transporter permease [Nocardioides alpinus]SFB44938.1 arabinogalactan oligomer / maltooligosaccharide transport system permease protein [Nocardioides alpinus]
MADLHDPSDADGSRSGLRDRLTKPGRDGIPALLVKVLFLGVVIGTAIALTPALVGEESWFFLVAIWAITAILVATYATGRALPAKYLVPGTLMLALFVVYPIVLTAQTSFTNYGDGTRNDKQTTVDQIVGASVTRSDDSPQYNLTIATDGDPTSGPFTYFLVPQDDPEAVFEGTADGLESDPDGVTLDNGRVTAVDGYTVLNIKQISAAAAELDEIAIPTESGSFIVRDGTSEAFEGAPTLVYDEDADTITDTTSDAVYTAEQVGDREYFVDEAGERISDQSWTANVGTANYERIFTDSRISSSFFGIFVWTFVFATLSVVGTFLLGLVFAVTLNDPRVRGQKIYRALLILPYAIPGFISLLLWSSFYNQDFGLINDITGLNVNWFGGATTAKIAVLLTNLWMGFPYMFLVATGALQAIPEDLTEAARIDGASGFAGFRRITFPLLLVTVAPLLVATFAFNFNNFGAIYLLTGGGPFSPDNPTAGGTDILISYTYRLAFGAGGVQIGFASAVSVVLFVITGIIAALQFRATRSLEDVN